MCHVGKGDGAGWKKAGTVLLGPCLLGPKTSEPAEALRIILLGGGARIVWRRAVALLILPPHCLFDSTQKHTLGAPRREESPHCIDLGQTEPVAL